MAQPGEVRILDKRVPIDVCQVRDGIVGKKGRSDLVVGLYAPTQNPEFLILNHGVCAEPRWRC